MATGGSHQSKLRGPPGTVSNRTKEHPLGQRNTSQKTDRRGTEPPVVEHHWSYVENQSPAEDDIDDLFESPSQRPDSHSRGHSTQGTQVGEKSSRARGGRNGSPRKRTDPKNAESLLPVPKGYLGGPEAAFDDDGEVDLLTPPSNAPRKRTRSGESEKSRRSKKPDDPERPEKESTNSESGRREGRGKGRERSEKSREISAQSVPAQSVPSQSDERNDEPAVSRRSQTSSRRPASSGPKKTPSRSLPSRRTTKTEPTAVSPSIPELSALVESARSLGLTASELRECSIAEISARLDRAGLRLPGELGPLGVAAMVFVAQLMEQNVSATVENTKLSAEESPELPKSQNSPKSPRFAKDAEERDVRERNAAQSPRSRANREKTDRTERSPESQNTQNVKAAQDLQLAQDREPSPERSESRKEPRSKRGARRGRERRNQSPFPPGSEPDSFDSEDSGAVPHTWSVVDDEPMETEETEESDKTAERDRNREPERNSQRRPLRRSSKSEPALKSEPERVPEKSFERKTSVAIQEPEPIPPELEPERPDFHHTSDVFEEDAEGIVETGDVANSPSGLASFGEMRFSAPMMRALQSAGYTHPTPIQAGLIPRALQGEDLMGQAQTGTGKTAAFAIPILEELEAQRTVRTPMAMVLCPTRELAVQTRDEFVKLSGSRRVRIVALYGGKPIKKQLDQLHDGTDIIVGTPGRVLDHLNRRTLSLSSLRTVVLDEADRMLDIGFRPDIEKILRQCPQSRQTLLLSATLPPPVKRLAERYMRDPAMLDFSPTDIASQTIEQYYFPVFQEEKYTLLQSLLKQEEPRQAIVFCRTRRGTEKIGRLLQRVFPSECEMIHGDLPQGHRDHVMRAFRAGEVRILVATDVVGRGIDVSGISHIINYDIPQFCDDYVHRVGRAGRMGREGVAFTLVTPEEGIELTRIEMRINKLLAKRDPADYMERQPHQGRPEFGTRPVLGTSDEQPDPEAAVKPPKPVFGRPTRRVKRSL